MSPRIVELRTRILKKNDEVARTLRARFADQGTFVVSLVSGPGAGKTELLQRTLEALRGTLRVAALVGDLATENDARRLSASGAPARQIVTGSVCHLEAQMVADALAEWQADRLDLLFIENVGNLVCPASFDLGEDLRVALLSVTDGEDKPLKYPPLFNSADLFVISKVDLSHAVGFDRSAALRALESVRPGATVLEVSARTGAGMDEWLSELRRRQADKRTER